LHVRAAEIEAGQYDDALAELMSLDLGELKRRYEGRDVEPK
jgi:hypothetical protein